MLERDDCRLHAPLSLHTLRYQEFLTGSIVSQIAVRRTLLRPRGGQLPAISNMAQEIPPPARGVLHHYVRRYSIVIHLHSG